MSNATDSGGYAVLNVERNVFMKHGAFGPHIVNRERAELKAEKADHFEVVAIRDGDRVLEISDAGRYENVFLGEEMVASFDHESDEFCVYDPHNDSEDPEMIFRP